MTANLDPKIECGFVSKHSADDRIAGQVSTLKLTT